MYLLVALSKDILVGNNILIISHHLQHVVFLNIFSSCLIGSFTKHINDVAQYMPYTRDWELEEHVLHFSRVLNYFFVIYNCL